MTSRLDCCLLFTDRDSVLNDNLVILSFLDDNLVRNTIVWSSRVWSLRVDVQRSGVVERFDFSSLADSSALHLTPSTLRRENLNIYDSINDLLLSFLLTFDLHLVGCLIWLIQQSVRGMTSRWPLRSVFSLRVAIVLLADCLLGEAHWGVPLVTSAATRAPLGRTIEHGCRWTLNSSCMVDDNLFLVRMRIRAWIHAATDGADGASVPTGVTVLVLSHAHARSWWMLTTRVFLTWPSFNRVHCFDRHLTSQILFVK